MIYPFLKTMRTMMTTMMTIMTMTMTRIWSIEDNNTIYVFLKKMMIIGDIHYCSTRSKDDEDNTIYDAHDDDEEYV